MDQDEGDGPAGPGATAEYLADVVGQLAAMAINEGLPETAEALLRAQFSALADMRRFQLEKAAPDDAA